MNIQKQINILKQLEELDNLNCRFANTDHKIRQLKTEYTTLKDDLNLMYKNKMDWTRRKTYHILFQFGN